MSRIKIFISSVQSEFAEERQMLVSYIRSDALLGKFFEPFIFEEIPAKDDTPQKVFISEVEQCDIYLGIYGEKYGYEDGEGISPTEHEYDYATEQHKCRLIYLKDVPVRHPKEERFIRKVQADTVRKSFATPHALRVAVYASLVRYMEENGIIRWRPFDAATDNGATINDLDAEKVKNFIHLARAKRNFPLTEDTNVEILLRHFDLMDDDGRIANAAILLFGKKPQNFFISSEVKCVQFYGNEVVKPIPSYQIYRGDVFELVTQATSFVMSRVDNWVGVRNGPTASVPTHPEFPMDAVQEAIVNAVCHRDYNSNASVQVMLFRNRLEVLNPGHLPFGMTIEKLLGPHKSLPTNPLLADPMYWCGYIEKLGTGTEDILKKCSDYGLKTPVFQQDEDFKITFWRNNADGNDTAVDSTQKVPQVIKTTQKTTQKTTRKTTQKIIDCIKQDATISRDDLAKKCGITSDGIKWQLKQMQEKGLLRRVGPDKGGHWEIIKQQ